MMPYNILTVVIDTNFLKVSPYILFNFILNPLVSMIIITYFINKEGLSLMKSFLISLTIALIIIVGMRLSYVLLANNYFQRFQINPWQLAPRNFTMFGGFVLAFPILYIICKIIHIKFWRILDLITPGWAFGIIFNKTGCLLNGCCYGVPTNLDFGISYPSGTHAYSYFYNELIGLVGENGDLTNSIPLHPVQTYEALVGLLGFIISIRLFKRKPKDGLIFAVFAMIYSFARFILNYLRATPYSMMEIKDLLPFLYFGVFIGTVFIFIYRYNSNL